MSVSPLSPVACTLTWLPDSLYTTCLSAVATNFPALKSRLTTISKQIKFDIYMKLYKQGQICMVGFEFHALDSFHECLTMLDKRFELHQCFQGLMDHGCRTAETLSHGFVHRCREAPDSEKPRLVNLGLLLGSFLIESAWFVDGERCIDGCRQLCLQLDDKLSLLECFMWLFQAYNGYCKYSEAFELLPKSLQLVDLLLPSTPHLNLAFLYCQYSQLYFNNSKFDKASYWSMESLRQITEKTPVKLTIDCCRQAAKVFGVRRIFKPAELMIKHAMSLTRYHFEGGRKYPDTLLDYGLYLLGVDMIESAAEIYQIALDYRQSSLGGQNIKVAQAHEDLAYALYVKEYSVGSFKNALSHAERAKEILQHLVPNDHLLHASSRRVKALILEEIAIDSEDYERKRDLLNEAKELHTGVLGLCRATFGEESLQTAKHYGNLGRLNQSQNEHEEARLMHLRAIAIKEAILGPDDYEVALSAGHLASLYNYDMNRYREAEELYLRSISIGVRLFGEAYSGLEYDYRGLIRVYEMLNQEAKAQEFAVRLQRWKALREDLHENRADAMGAIPEVPEDSMKVIANLLKWFTANNPETSRSWSARMVERCEGS